MTISLICFCFILVRDAAASGVSRSIVTTSSWRPFWAWYSADARDHCRRLPPNCPSRRQLRCRGCWPTHLSCRWRDFREPATKPKRGPSRRPASRSKTPGAIASCWLDLMTMDEMQFECFPLISKWIVQWSTMKRTGQLMRGDWRHLEHWPPFIDGGQTGRLGKGAISTDEDGLEQYVYSILTFYLFSCYWNTQISNALLHKDLLHSTAGIQD